MGDFFINYVEENILSNKYDKKYQKENTKQSDEKIIKTVRGLIVKALGGFYYVKPDDTDEIIECRARGLFRKNEITPLVGDHVLIEITENSLGYVVEIVDRKNSLIRPPVANIECLVLVVSFTDPKPNYLVIDKLTAIASKRDIPVVLVFTKTDLYFDESYIETYKKAGYKVYSVDSLSNQGVDELKPLFNSGIYVFCGNSGVGKSSLLNAIFPSLELKTGDISKKLGRGRHTTRHVELYSTGNGYIADTPGFSAIEFLQFEKMLCEDLQYCFPEINDRMENCKFTGCSHTKEKGCAIIDAVNNGEVARSRYDSYCTIYEELKQVKKWEL